MPEVRRQEGPPQVFRVWHGEPQRGRCAAVERLELRLVPRQQLRGVPSVSENPQSSEPRPFQEILWAPWRMDYILQPRTDGCFLCHALAAKDDSANFVVQRRSSCFALLNRFPYNNGHLLVSPNAHRGELSALSDEELTELVRLTRDMQQLLQDAIAPHGFNIGINLGQCAGAGLPGHLHVHLVPRWTGDTNFMPVTAQSKVLVQSLEALYRLLREKMGMTG